VKLSGRFQRLGIVLKPDARSQSDSDGILNPASARLRDGSLQLYPRMVQKGNISRIGSFRGTENNGTVIFEQEGYALEPQAEYEFRDVPGGYGCEDPRVTFIPTLDRYVMTYVAFGPHGPAVALALSGDGLSWERLGLVTFKDSEAPVADKDSAFFPEPVRSPSGVESLAFYHRPTLAVSLAGGATELRALEALPADQREGIAIGYVTLADVRGDVRKLCDVSETRRLVIPPADWGTIKVGAGAPPVRIREGWLSVIHGVDPLEHEAYGRERRYSAGIIVSDAEHIERVLYRSPHPIVVPKVKAELEGVVGEVVFPTAIDPRPEIGERVFDIYYGMGDDDVGRGRLILD
jgi:predicted GH43/DUF377 family glycosyl hydrolase